MKTIKNNETNEIIINKSKFITYLYKVNNKNEFLSYLNKLQKLYKDATHICYAYIIDQEIKYNDDNEPLKTAGLPILEVLKKKNLNHIACIVIRYFGGIKLGSNGLIRAYSNSCKLCLDKSIIIDLKELKKIKIITNYHDLNKIERIIEKENIIEKIFNDKIIIISLIDSYIELELINNNINYIILENIYN